MSWRIGFILLFTHELIVAVNLHLLIKRNSHQRSGESYNDNSTGIRISISSRIKYNGRFLKRGFVPVKSRVTLTCKVSFKRVSEDVFTVMLIGFRLPNGKDVVPGNCIVRRSSLSKRCKMFIKKAKLADEGTYRCLVYYIYQGKSREGYKDIFLNISKPQCPPSKIFCNASRKCVDHHIGCRTKRECSSSEFKCKDGYCIIKQYKCDDIPDCMDGSDEVNCDNTQNTCREKDSFLCKNGHCLLSEVRCNGISDCQDNSDEMNCTECPVGYFQCKNGSNCFWDSCSTLGEIVGFSNKKKPCKIPPSSKIGCSTGKCIKKEQICNGIKECADGSDEWQCSTHHAQIADYSSSSQEKSSAVYGIIVAAMVFFTTMFILFSIWIKRKRRNLERRFLRRHKVHQNLTRN